jgi:hypothetical protein
MPRASTHDTTRDRNERSYRADERAQLMLGTAVVIAVVIIALAITVNTAFLATTTGTGVTDSQDVQNADTINYHVQHSVHNLITRENTIEYTSRADATSATRSGIRTIETQTHDQEFKRGGVLVYVQTTSLTPGFVVAQNETRAYTSGGSTVGKTEWTIGTADNIRDFTTTFDPSSLEPVDGGNAFNLTVTGVNGDTWTGRVGTNSTSDVVVLEELDDGTETVACTITTADTRETVTWTSDTLNNESCNMTFTDGLNAPYTIQYANAGNAIGTWSLTLSDTSNTTLNTQHLSDPGSTASPRYYHGTYSASITVTYGSETLTGTRNVPVIAPGEHPDAR